MYKTMKIKKILVAMALFSPFSFAEAQQVWTPDNGDGTFTNPLMWGDWPDPDVIRVGDEFYMVSTSMHYVPGSPVAKSKDLVNWEMVGYAVDRYDEDPRYDMQGGTLYLNGSWANSIRYHNGRFYVAFCTPYGWGTEKGNFCICEADKPEGPWKRTVFPEYLYDNSNLGLKIMPAEGQKPELLWLPASEQQIRRTLLRAGVRDAGTAQYTIDAFFLQKEVGELLDEKQDSLTALNAMSSAIAKLDEKGQNKLEAVIVFADPKNAAQICQLAKNLDLFSFIPGVHTPEEYGKYMIQESGRFEYDDNLDGFYNYKSYGEHRIQQEDGCFSAYGYVAYRGMLSLEELMAEDPAEQTQQNQGPVMGMRGFS